MADFRGKSRFIAPCYRPERGFVRFLVKKKGAEAPFSYTDSDELIDTQ